LNFGIDKGGNKINNTAAMFKPGLLIVAQVPKYMD